MKNRELKTKQWYDARSRAIAKMKRDQPKGIFVGDWRQYTVYDRQHSKLIISGG